MVLKMRLDPQWVLDQAQPYEIRTLLQYEWMAHSDLWQSQRMIAYLNTQCHSTKKITPQDICEFYFEEEETENSEPETTQEDRDAMKAAASALCDMFNRKFTPYQQNNDLIDDGEVQ